MPNRASAKPQRDDPAQEVLFFAERSLVEVVQLGHAIRRAQVFVAQDHDHVIGKPDSLHEARDQIAWAHSGLVAEDIPAILSERLTEPIDDFRALPCVLGRIIAPRVRDENLRCTFIRQFVAGWKYPGCPGGWRPARP